jgi:hypothetical protein
MVAVSSLRSSVTEPATGPTPIDEWRLKPDVAETGEIANPDEWKAKRYGKERQHYISRLPFHALPGKTKEVEHRLTELRSMIIEAGGERCRILRPHFASDGAPDLILEQEVDSLTTLESQISAVTANPEFQVWTTGMSPLLVRSPKREILLVTDEA